LRAAVSSLPPSHLLLPIYSEVFASGEVAEIRLHNYVFAHRYCLVRDSRSLKSLRLWLACKHYSNKTKNKRRITEEERYKVNEQGRYLRRPNTKVAFTDYYYAVNVAFKHVVGGGGRKA